MILGMACRVTVIFFLLFSYFINVFANTSEKFFITATNTINSDQSAVMTCASEEDIESKNCNSFGTSINLSNPISLAHYKEKLIIANYGKIRKSGTSFALRCDLPRLNETYVNCESIFALVSTAQITGMTVVDNKMIVIESFAYNHNMNINYIVSCTLPDEGRINSCSTPLRLFSFLGNPQNGFNTSMPITLHNNFVYVEDKAGETVFKCTLPDFENKISCEPIDFKKAAQELQKGFNNPLVIDFYH